MMLGIRTSTSHIFLSIISLSGLLCTLSSGQELQYPLAIATHGEAIYLVDRNLPGIWKSERGKLSIYFQASKTYRTPLNAPRCAAIDAQGRLYVGDSATREVYRFDEKDQPQPLTHSSIGIPMGIAITADGNLLVSDLELHRICKIKLSGDKKPVVENYAEVPAPSGNCLDAEDRLWVVSRDKDALLRVSKDRKVETVVSGRAFGFPHAVLLDKEGTAYVSDGYGKTIWKVPADGKPLKWAAGEPLVSPEGLAWRDGNLLVVDPRAKGVFQIEPDGKISAVDLGTAP
jgi:sugar lactone lactonase YvrE